MRISDVVSRPAEAVEEATNCMVIRGADGDVICEVTNPNDCLTDQDRAVAEFVVAAINNFKD